MAAAAAAKATAAAAPPPAAAAASIVFYLFFHLFFFCFLFSHDLQIQQTFENEKKRKRRVKSQPIKSMTFFFF